MDFAWTIVALIVVMVIAWRFLGSYMAAVFQGRVRWLGLVERPIYRIIGVDPDAEQSWQCYSVSLIIFSAVALAVTYAIFRLQGYLPFNPQHLGGVTPALAWNTSVSFVTNTNWQAYSGETTMSYLSQMGALAVQNFASAAVGIAVAVALIRGFARRGAKTIGNFWVDLVRCTIYVLLPIAFVAAIVFIGQGALQTLSGPAHVHDALNGMSQVIPRGPVASQETIKQLGTNGGGFFNANGADPFENPTGLTNFLSIVLLLCIPVGLTYTFGKMAGSVRQGAAILGVMAILFGGWLAIASVSEHQANPAVAAAGATYQPAGNMEGKEVRFGDTSSALYATASTQTSTGGVDSAEDSYTPMGGFAVLTGMMLGEVSPGGVGSGLYTILLFAIVAVFIGGLMVGRTPEYLGKKIQAREVKLATFGVALTILLAALTIVFVPVVVTLEPYGRFAGASLSVVILIALLVCLIPTTIGALLSAIGIAGMDRLVQRNVLAMSGRAVEAAGDVQTLLLDKTGTITLGNRMASAFYPIDGHSEQDVASAAQLASLSDETPEGRSIVVLAKERFGLRERELGQGHEFVPFSAHTRMSGLDFDGQQIRKGAVEAVRRWVTEQGGQAPAGLDGIAERIARSGATPLAVADGPRLLGVIELKDMVKVGIRERFGELRAAGIRTVMITGDNPLTAAAIAQEAGVHDYLAEATPEAKMNLIKAEQQGGKLVAMTGDGTNDAPALAQADVGVAMNTGTTAAKEAGNMVDLDSSPTKLIDIVEIGKQLLITRGALTTFSIANDVAKYFAIIPALFVATYPQLHALNIMRLHSAQSAVLSAVIFNALVIVALIPLALRGVRFRPSGAAAILRRNVFIYGVGGIIVPFIFIKLIDLILTATGLF